MKIPKSLFDSLQTSLNQEAKRLCRDAAKILKIPEKDLVGKIINKMPKITIIEDNSTPYTCPVLIENNLLERCRRSCLLGTGRCLEHQNSSNPEPTTQKQLTRIQSTTDSPNALWCYESTGDVYNKELKIIGQYKNNRLTLYDFQE
jgi:hypothetical protein